MKIFNQVTELTIDNFQNWKTTILYLLSINNLDEYVSTPKVKKKKLRKKYVRGNINNYIVDKFNTSPVYDIGISQKKKHQKRYISEVDYN